MKANVTLVNSNWTGEHVSRFLGITDANVVSARGRSGAGLPWAERRNGFLAVGRISPEKEYERVMQILARVRQQVPGHHAHDRRHMGSPYAALLRDR